MNWTNVKPGINYDDYIRKIDSHKFPIIKADDAVNFLNELIEIVGEDLNIDTYNSIKYDSLTRCNVSTYPYNMNLICDNINKISYSLHVAFLSLERVDINGYCFLAIRAGGFNSHKNECSMDSYIPQGELVLINPTKNDVYLLVKSYIEQEIK